MACKICGQPCSKPVEGKPIHVFCKGTHDTIGYWAKPLEDADLCWFHQKQVDGHFDRGDEYYRKPDQWTILGPR